MNTDETQGSLSSIQTAESKRPTKVIELGKRITEELGVHKSCDTLCKWLAHYLAESILAVEEESEADRRELAESRCVDLILRIWSARASLPYNARPTGRLDEAIDAIVAINDEREQLRRVQNSACEGNDNGWLVFALKSYAIDKRMAHMALLMGIFECDLGAEKRWAEVHGSHLTEAEQGLIDALDSWVDSPIEWASRSDRESVANLEPEERCKVVLNELSSLFAAQERALELLRETLEKRNAAH